MEIVSCIFVQSNGVDLRIQDRTLHLATIKTKYKREAHWVMGEYWVLKFDIFSSVFIASYNDFVIWSTVCFDWVKVSENWLSCKIFFSLPCSGYV